MLRIKAKSASHIAKLPSWRREAPLAHLPGLLRWNGDHSTVDDTYEGTPHMATPTSQSRVGAATTTGHNEGVMDVRRKPEEHCYKARKNDLPRLTLSLPHLDCINLELLLELRNVLAQSFVLVV